AYPVQVLNMMTKENALDVESIDAIIAATYDVISGPAGKRRDWDRERSLFYPGARLIPTATMWSLRRKFWRWRATSPGWNLCLRKAVFTKQKSPAASNILGVSRTFGARMNHAVIPAIPSRSCAVSTASNFSMMESIGASL